MKLYIRVIRQLLYIFFAGYLFVSAACADERFKSNYPCRDVQKECISSGTRTIGEYEVYRDCWEYQALKVCDYPSKDDCGKYSHCYFVSMLECLLTDSQGNCVNRREEYSCKRWVPAIKESTKARVRFQEKEGQEGIICEGIPCIDGNCVDHRFLTNGEMMDSISKLYAVSEMKAGDGVNISLFKGNNEHCSKKATGYTNCCTVSLKGWGSNLGAKCSKNEQLLIEKRKKNLCVYVGKESNKKAGVTTLVKHHYCCFGTLLDKVVQVQARKQLGLSFGSGKTPDCRGLTLEEIQRINWDEIDFTEFIEDLKVKFFLKYKMPGSSDLKERINNSLPDIREFDGNVQNQDNNASGWRVGESG